MPVINLGPIPDLDEYAFARVFAVMLFPNDPMRRGEFLAFAKTQAPLEPLSGTKTHPLYSVLNDSRKRFLGEGNRVERGTVAGEIFLTLRRIHEHHRNVRSDEPSIGKAIAVVAGRCRRAPANFPKSQSALQAASVGCVLAREPV